MQVKRFASNQWRSNMTNVVEIVSCLAASLGVILATWSLKRTEGMERLFIWLSLIIGALNVAIRWYQIGTTLIT
jgi:hypothetical protein